MPERGEVIFLKFQSPHVDDDTMAFLACKVCRNKTYTMTRDKMDGFPLMRCAACGHHMGRMGWAYDDDTPPEQSQKSAEHLQISD